MLQQPNELRGTLRINWMSLGQAAVDSAGKLKFPNLSTMPGLYRFSVQKSDGLKAVYIGETDNLQRRFAHYRNPGPTQPTNLRLNILFKQLLSDGAQIEISVVIEDAWINWGGSETIANFSSKNVRRLFENFALAADRGTEVESLNK